MKGKKIQFPTAFTVLFLVTILVAGLTFVLPAGQYDTLSYNSQSQTFELHAQQTTTSLPGTQSVLDSFGITINIEKFESGALWKPVSIPGTYHQVAEGKMKWIDVIQAPLKGISESIDIILFVLIIGGFIGVMNGTGVFDTGIQQLSKKLKGKEQWLIIIVCTLMALGGTTFGLAEETIAFYPILMPVFLAARYDAIVAVGSIFLGSCIGTMVSTTNPFSVIIASDAAGIKWTDGLEGRIVFFVIALIITLVYLLRYAKKIQKDPSLSIIKDQNEDIERHFLHQDQQAVKAYSWRTQLVLFLFLATFIVMIYGVATQGWWFLEMTTVFFVASILIGMVERLGEKKFVQDFMAGAKDLLGVALIIGLARGVTLIMEEGMIGDTMIYYASNAVEGMNKGLFIGSMMGVFSALSFFIPSSSGMAVLTMPIMAPLADIVALPRYLVVNSYIFGMGLLAMITPTGLILATLTMVKVGYNKWFKFVMPLIGILAAVALAFLILLSFLA